MIKRNGATELALGVAVAVDKTRKAGLIGTAVYAALAGARAASNRRSA